MSDQAISRREFFSKAGTPLLAGLAAGTLLVPVGLAANAITENTTNHPAGNANIDSQVQKACAEDEDPIKCMDNYELPKDTKLRAVIDAPISEELIFRAFPSVAVDTIESVKDDYDENCENPLLVLARGTNRKHFTRGEVIAGVGSTLLFGAAHNITNQGFNTRMIPSSQLIGGGVAWVLQRRFGFLANTSAHATLNGLDIFSGLDK